MLKPPIPMIAGYGAVPPDGALMDAENVMDFPPFETTTVILPPIKVPVTLDGFSGLVPNSYFWKRSLISCLRQGQSDFLVTFVPLAKVNGSGSSLSAVKL